MNYLPICKFLHCIKASCEVSLKSFNWLSKRCIYKVIPCKTPSCKISLSALRMKCAELIFYMQTYMLWNQVQSISFLYANVSKLHVKFHLNLSIGQGGDVLTRSHDLKQPVVNRVVLYALGTKCDEFPPYMQIFTLYLSFL